MVQTNGNDSTSRMALIVASLSPGTEFWTALKMSK